jgi:hypothetical protein
MAWHQIESTGENTRPTTGCNTGGQTLLKVQIFHANAVDKLTRVNEQMTGLVANLEKDDIVSINTTEIASPQHQFYSYTVMVTYNAKE